MVQAKKLSSAAGLEAWEAVAAEQIAEPSWHAETSSLPLEAWEVQKIVAVSQERAVLVENLHQVETNGRQVDLKTTAT